MRKSILVAGLTACLCPAALAQTTEIQGYVYAGVEAGCLLLDDADTGITYELYGCDQHVCTPGFWIVAWGIPHPDWFSICMQGMPFEVLDAQVIWWWPPEECTVEPQHPTSDEQVTITIGGIWPNTCVPLLHRVTVGDDVINLEVVAQEPGGCFQVLTPWSLSATVGPLPLGPYAVTATLYIAFWDVLITGPPALCVFSVDDAPCEPVPIETFPPNCAIDARQPSDPDGSNPAGWDTVSITFDSEVDCLGPGDFDVLDLGWVLPEPILEAVIPKGDTLTLQLSHAIPLSRWLCIRYEMTEDVFCWGHLPGDVSGEGVSCPKDILVLIDCLNGVRSCAIWQCDVDRSGVCGPPDILRVIDLLNGAAAYKPWLGRRFFFPCPSKP